MNCEKKSKKQELKKKNQLLVVNFYFIQTETELKIKTVPVENKELWKKKDIFKIKIARIK